MIRRFFLASVVVIGGGVVLGEIFADPVIDTVFRVEEGGVEWEEMGIWLAAALAMGAGLSAFLRLESGQRLARLTRAAEEMRRGNFAVKVPESGVPDDCFNKLARDFNAMAETVGNRMRNERRLLADVSHELRSPLARVSAGVELLRRRNSDPDSRLGKIAGDIEHMRCLVAVLLEQGGIRLAALEKRETIDLSAFARNAGEGFRTKGAAQGKTLLSEIEPGLRIDAHPVQVLLIFENILENALLHTPAGCRIELRVCRSGGSARITVRDWGEGVPEEKLPSLFHAFFRVDPSRARKNGGIGLGLTLVQEACRSLGGNITAKNAVPGLEMTVSLPLMPLSAFPLRGRC